MRKPIVIAIQITAQDSNVHSRVALVEQGFYTGKATIDGDPILEVE